MVSELIVVKMRKSGYSDIAFKLKSIEMTTVIKVKEDKKKVDD